jgi:hypothetical protein
MKEGLRMKLINSHGRIPMPPPYEGSMSNASTGEWGSHAPISFTHYKIFGQMQHQISVVKDPKIVAIVFSLPFFLVKCCCTCDCSNRRMQRVMF